jgi:phycocyanobilin:ferredoxin oxidoreductase
MDALPLMTQAASLFHKRLIAESGCVRLPPPPDVMCATGPAANLQWDNVLLSSPAFRRAHIETFNVPGRVSVLHVCIFPHINDPAPIFGFDMVAGPSRVTGIFLDLSPVTDQPPCPRLRDVSGCSDFAVKRTLPEWGDIFSTDVLAVRPVNLDEVSRAISLGLRALDSVLAAPRSLADVVPPAIAAGQARYMAGQRRNEHTFRMLASFIGHGPARRFIDEVLFPMDESLSTAASLEMA